MDLNSYDPDPQHQVLGKDPPSAGLPFGPTVRIDTARVLAQALAKQLGIVGAQNAFGVITAHEFGHSLLQQG